ncbi:MAG TPA: 7-carboxy-7-deazaguanine synthase QueE [Pirellulaceae bacterium]
MRIAEIYKSIQGEGRWTGAASVFIRVSGCNLRCGYCDTPFTSWEPEGEDLPLADIVAAAVAVGRNKPGAVPAGTFDKPDHNHNRGAMDAPHVVITGGEPMLFAELIPLTEALRDLGYCITIETAGTLYLPVVCDLMSISPKLSNSTPDIARHPSWNRRHEATRRAPAVVERLTREFDYQLKFVVREPDDVTEIEQYLREFPRIPRNRVFLMPEGTTSVQLRKVEQWLVPECERLGYLPCPRRHIEWFGHTRGT